MSVVNLLLWRQVEYASEFRYKKPVLYSDEDVVLVTSQSGETADTLAAIREAKKQGVMTIGIVNVVGSTIGASIAWPLVVKSVIYRHNFGLRNHSNLDVV